MNEANYVNPLSEPQAPTPDDPPWNILVALGVWLLSVVLIFLIPTLFVGPYAISRGIDIGNKEALTNFLFSDQTAIILQLAPVILAHALTLLVAWFVVTRSNTFSFRRTLGWTMNGFKVWHAFAITLAFYGIFIALVNIFGKVDNEFSKMISNSRYAVYLVAFFATFTAPLTEEVIYRGLLYSAFQRPLGKVLAIVFVTILFTLVHVPQYSMDSQPDIATLVTLLLVSLTLTLIRAQTGSLLPCIVLHTIFNGIQSGLLLAEPYLRFLEPAIEPTTTSFIK